MVRVASVFSQILGLFNRAEFSDIVAKHKGERHSKGFTCWTQFVSMLFCQVAQAHSLNEICNGLQCCFGKLKHLGLTNAPKKSTLAYANAKRPWQIYQDVFYTLLSKCQTLASDKKQKFRFKNKLYSLDASTIDLCLSMFDWAKYKRTKGAVKLHLLLDHDGYLPTFVHITTGKVHEVNIAHQLTLASGSIVAMDRGYVDYSLFGKWTTSGIYFVTRMKSNASYTVIEKRRLPKHRNILGDEIIQLKGMKAQLDCPHLLRRIVVWDKENEKEIVLLTNHLSFGSTTISKIYKERWQIEIFFKAIKQNLRIKTFVGTSKNALLIQIWTALIAILILKYLMLKSIHEWSLSNLCALLKWNLFTYRDLWKWIDNPLQPPPQIKADNQLNLEFV